MQLTEYVGNSERSMEAVFAFGCGLISMVGCHKTSSGGTVQNDIHSLFPLFTGRHDDKEALCCAKLLYELACISLLSGRVDGTDT